MRAFPRPTRQMLSFPISRLSPTVSSRFAYQRTNMGTELGDPNDSLVEGPGVEFYPRRRQTSDLAG